MAKVLADMTIAPDGLARLKRIDGLQVVLGPDHQDMPHPFPQEQIQAVDFLLCTFPPANHEQMTALKLIQIGSAGYSQLYGLNLVARGIRACNGRGVFDVPIAEWNIAMMINLARDFRGMIRNQDASTWDRQPRFEAEIRGRTVGIWGYGGIGRQTARLAKALGLNVHVMTRSPIEPRTNCCCVPGTGDPEGCLPDRTFLYEQRSDFLRGLDFLVLAMPLTASTRGIVGAAELQTLPPTAYVLNPARGPLIQEEALLCALRERWIAGAALDTHYYYPLPPSHPLWAMPNVILTPHISGSGGSPYYAQRVWDIFVQNVERYLTGRPLLNELTASQLTELAGE
jgi:phosphoglycerate dehydrogenase-like enzyme